MSGRGVPSPCYLSFVFHLSLDTATCWSGRRRDNLAEEQPQSSRAQSLKLQGQSRTSCCNALQYPSFSSTPRTGWLSPRLRLQPPPTYPAASVQSRRAPRLSTGSLACVSSEGCLRTCATPGPHRAFEPLPPTQTPHGTGGPDEWSGRHCPPFYWHIHIRHIRTLRRAGVRMVRQQHVGRDSIRNPPGSPARRRTYRTRPRACRNYPRRNA
ncbi:hypothetical protein L226DRAFT_96445 [Lentinus tigrinus ALCF2SS1-7]|uniref:uncharacterized protein n=1 Tax=Lentinus tigrinus ALCF2SS1-7 TaxID=1328758 RepID=UPI001166265A|nr:hypothetical protein L226DRAFT_96445 [Lentinus tigrinus ALCF2SS1-7]